MSALPAKAKQMIKRRTTIDVQTQRLSVIRPTASAIDVWCETCGAIVPMFVPERAAELSHTTPREIYRRVETGEIHFVETDSGELLICESSLGARASLPALSAPRER